jgi:hypothetical protein
MILAALVMGLLGSAHCIVMCGGIVGMLSAGASRARLTIAYNLGRITSYAAAGAIAGLVGHALDGARVGLRFAAALLMIGVGLYVAGRWRRFAALERIGAPLWKRVEPMAKGLLPVRTVPRALALGGLWGWMPCGLVYGALALAVTGGGAATGALTMLAFGAGTLPVLLALGALASYVKALARVAWVRTAAGLVIVALGGYQLSAVASDVGWSPLPRTHECCAQKKK